MEETRRERKKRLTRRLIVTAALRLFEEHGYEGTTVAQITAAADVDPKTFFNYFRSKDEVLFVDTEHTYALLLGAIAERRPKEGPAEVLARMLERFTAHHMPELPPGRARELALAYRLVSTVPALQAKALYLLFDLQHKIADELCAAFPGHLDPITAAAMTGSLMGAVQQAGIAAVRLGRPQQDLWEAARVGVGVAMDGLRAQKGPDDHG
ncbi:TetR/AcrR family transcriptional regulator [Sphaerisporangium corydalis]|uniref:TetR/AcrR family transcriptional regulator n=1 Tax=Sphaerisporangium corydalis TaxID=1441875 RepID=A0ABV9EHA1_9ACTN|nr:TetR/AcrR family transcriptional regulator [Sphaerisporangium corydalis]